MRYKVSASWRSQRKSKKDKLEAAVKLYRFITGPDDSAFCHRVTAALNKGWELAGSPTYAFNAATGLMHCGQPVTKEVPGEEYHPEIKLGEW